jgi:hypothetical protein
VSVRRRAAFIACALLLSSCVRHQPSTGSIEGTLRLIGGPNNVMFKATGTVTASGSRGEAKVAHAGSDGRFTLRLRPGDYVVSGSSPAYNENNGGCTTANTVTVRRSQVAKVDVICSMR